MRAALLFAVLLVGCTPATPPTPSVDASVAPIPAPRPSSASTESDAAAPVASAAPIVDAAAPVAIVDAGDPGSLPQTHDKPPPSSPALDARIATLWDAIVNDEPDRATPAFFPVTAYEQVKAITNASSDWRHRLVGNFKRDVHALHKRLGENAKFLRLEVPQDRARWVDPGEESNKLGY